MKGYINDIDWVERNPMKYWSAPSSYSEEKKKQEVTSAIFGGDYIGARKVDGYYQRIVKDEDGNIFMIARSRNVKGEVVDKHEWVPHLNEWFDGLPNGTCLLCECYLPGQEGSKNITTLLGCLKEKAIARQKEKKLHLYVFDIMSYDNSNHIYTAYEERANLLEEISHLHKSEYVEWAEFYEGKELWNMLQTYLANGYEGMVIMRKDAIVYDKRTPAHISIKIKKELQENIDVVLIGANEPTQIYNGKEIVTWKYWFNLRTFEKIEGEYYKDFQNGAPIEPITKNYFYGRAGSLKIGAYKDGKMVQVGSLSGLTEEILENWKSYIGKVVEVQVWK